MNESVCPRVAESLDDLAVGMVVVQRVNGEWLNPFTLTEDDIYGQIWWTKQFEKSPLVILEEPDPPTPPAPDWLVPADTMEAITAVLRDHLPESVNSSHVDCWCGWTVEPTPKLGRAALMELHRAHVASVLADLMADGPTLADAPEGDR